MCFCSNKSLDDNVAVRVAVNIFVHFNFLPHRNSCMMLVLNISSVPFSVWGTPTGHLGTLNREFCWYSRIENFPTPNRNSFILAYPMSQNHNVKAWIGQYNVQMHWKLHDGFMFRIQNHSLTRQLVSWAILTLELVNDVSKLGVVITLLQSFTKTFSPYGRITRWNHFMVCSNICWGRAMHHC